MGDIRVGKPDTRPDAPAHVKGINKGNEPGAVEADPGIYFTGESGPGKPRAKATMRKSTGINAGHRNPVDPNSPTMPPA